MCVYACVCRRSIGRGRTQNVNSFPFQPIFDGQTVWNASDDGWRLCVMCVIVLVFIGEPAREFPSPHYAQIKIRDGRPPEPVVPGYSAFLPALEKWWAGEIGNLMLCDQTCTLSLCVRVVRSKVIAKPRAQANVVCAHSGKLWPWLPEVKEFFPKVFFFLSGGA